jgi:hypothetical protein
MKIYKISIAFFLLAAVAITGCKKSYLETKPSDEVPLSDAFKTTTGCKAALQGINRIMFSEGSSSELFGEPCIMLMEDLMGEDMPISGQGSGWLVGTYDYTDARNAGGPPGYTWNFYYRIIQNANLLLDHVDKATGPEDDKAFIKGQALFYRAFALYKLSLYYQHTYAGNSDQIGGLAKNRKGVPVYTTATQDGAGRGTLEQTYAQITKDLDAALLLLPKGTRVDKTDPDLTVAKGLYARVALVMNNWALAATMASEARASYNFMSRDQLLLGFNDITNSEWMWGCSINSEQTGIFASFLSHVVVESDGYAVAQQKLGFKFLADSLQKGDTGDIRKNWWYNSSPPVGYSRYSQRKFKIKKIGSWAGDLPFMRASEMALIEAEARTQNNDVAGGGAILEALIKIRNPYFVVKTNKVALLQQIMFQRRIELWGEGFRFSDIKRYMTLPGDVIPNTAQGLHRPPNHNQDLVGQSNLPQWSNFFLFRIPGGELNNNSAMTGADQNP